LSRHLPDPFTSFIYFPIISLPGIKARLEIKASPFSAMALDS
jgi:hypothetical protein